MRLLVMLLLLPGCSTPVAAKPSAPPVRASWKDGPEPEWPTEAAASKSVHSAEVEYEAQLQEFKARLSKDAREGFPKKCGIEVMGIKQDAIKLVLYDNPKSKKHFRKYDEKGLAGVFDVYCDGTIAGAYRSGQKFKIEAMVDGSGDQARKCERACQSTTAACKQFERGSMNYYTHYDRHCHTHCG